ncbi:MAG: hypothetical protein FWE03_01455 [Firmicutes bacterium]|nr:hypothetical protein [Bacillota bacterium]
MTIRSCAIRAAKYLGLKELANNIEDNIMGDEDRDAFIAMTRDVVHEIVTDFFPLRVIRMVDISNGSFNLRVLNDRVAHVFSIKKDGVNFRFRTRFDRVETNAEGLCEVEYSYLPILTSMNTVIPIFAKINERIIGYGIAAEYCLINGLSDALIWDKRYKDALRRTLATKGEKQLRKRAWW